MNFFQRIKHSYLDETTVENIAIFSSIPGKTLFQQILALHQSGFYSDLVLALDPSWDCVSRDALQGLKQFIYQNSKTTLKLYFVAPHKTLFIFNKKRQHRLLSVATHVHDIIVSNGMARKN